MGIFTSHLILGDWSPHWDLLLEVRLLNLWVVLIVSCLLNLWVVLIISWLSHVILSNRHHVHIAGFIHRSDNSPFLLRLFPLVLSFQILDFLGGIINFLLNSLRCPLNIIELTCFLLYSFIAFLLFLHDFLQHFPISNPIAMNKAANRKHPMNPWGPFPPLLCFDLTCFSHYSGVGSGGGGGGISLSMN